MSSSKQVIVNQHKQEYLELILKQKTEGIDRYKQKSEVYVIVCQKEQELLSLCNQPICQPKIFKIEEATLMSDDDFLLAELNGHFQ